MEKTTPLKIPKLDALDSVVFLAMAVVPFSYFLGFNLDWSEQAQAMPAAPMTFQAGRAPEPPVAFGPTASELAAAPKPAVQEDLTAWNDMVRNLEKEAISYPGRVAIYLKDLKRNRTWEYRADDL